MTRDQKTYRVACWLACFIIAGTFLSGFQKILYPADFALAVYRFHLLPGFAVNIVSLWVQWLEAVCAVCLLFVPKFRVAALWVSLVLLVLFTGGIAANLIRGSAFSCGCFSASPLAKPMDWLSVWRNMALALLAVLALVSFRRARK